MELVSLREFARKKGVSLQAVQNGIKSLRIVPERDESGKAIGLNWETEGPKWESNANPGKKQSADARKALNPPKETPPKRPPGRPKKADRPVSDDDEPAQGKKSPEVVAAALFAVSRSRKEKALADTAELDRDEKLGLLVRANKVELELTKMVTAAKTKILSIKSRVKTKFPDIDPKILLTLDEVCREALKELADGVE